MVRLVGTRCLSSVFGCVVMCVVLLAGGYLCLEGVFGWVVCGVVVLDVWLLLRAGNCGFDCFVCGFDSFGW